MSFILSLAHFAARCLHALLAAVFALTMANVTAAPFSITADTTSAQVLGAGQTGTVADGSTLSVSGPAVAVSITGNRATLNNLGTIDQTGTGRAVRDTTGVADLVINNGSPANARATIRSADNDAIQMDVPKASVTLNNHGALIALKASGKGAQAVDFSAVEGANVVNNYQGAIIRTARGRCVRPGENGLVFNAGSIVSTAVTDKGDGAIDGGKHNGIRITNDSTGLIDGSRHGITGKQADASVDYTMTVTNDAGGIIRGSDGAGLNLDGTSARQVITVRNRGTIIGNGVTGDGDGIDVDAMVDITNSGIIRSVNAVSPQGSGPAFSEGISAAGGTIVNTGTIEGLVAAGNGNAVGRGITLAGNDHVPPDGQRDGIYGNASVSNQSGGRIHGDSDSAIVAAGEASGHTITVENHAGATIRGGGTAYAAIRTVADRTVIVNAGTIDGASSGKAVEMGSANNHLVISGAQAAVIGSINGGVGGNNTMVVDAGVGHSFSYAGAIANFSSVSFDSGDVTLSGQSTYMGDTIVKGGSLTLVGANRIAAASALVLGGGRLNLAGTGSGQRFASLSVLDNSTIHFDAHGSKSPLTFASLGTIAAGKTLTLSSTDGAAGVPPLRFVGDVGSDARFVALTHALRAGDSAVTVDFDGTHTTVAQVPKPGSIALHAIGLPIPDATAEPTQGGERDMIRPGEHGG